MFWMAQNKNLKFISNAHIRKFVTLHLMLWTEQLAVIVPVNDQWRNINKPSEILSLYSIVHEYILFLFFFSQNCCWLLLKWYIICFLGFLFMVHILGFVLHKLQIVCIIHYNWDFIHLRRVFASLVHILLHSVEYFNLKLHFFITFLSNYFQIKSQTINYSGFFFFVLWTATWRWHMFIIMKYTKWKLLWAEIWFVGFFHSSVLFVCLFVLMVVVPWC